MHLQIHLLCFYQMSQPPLLWLGHSEVAEEAVYANQKIRNTRVRQLYSGYSSAASVPRSLFLSVK